MNEPKKKETNAQLKKRIERAKVHIDRTKNTSEIFFSDKGLRLCVNDDAAIIGTGYHDHVFQPHTSSGVSRPYIYIKRFIELAKENDCVTTDANGNKFYSYQKLMAVLKEKGTDNPDYLVAYYVDLWLENCFNPLYSIGENEVESFLVYEMYLHNIARNAVLLSEKKEDMTNRQFLMQNTMLSFNFGFGVHLENHLEAGVYYNVPVGKAADFTWDKLSTELKDTTWSSAKTKTNAWHISLTYFF
jgi:hypothetical protein